MDKVKVLLILDELISFYVDAHQDDESNPIIDNIDEFEMLIEKVMKSVPIE
jgi:hypothetical protein